MLTTTSGNNATTSPDAFVRNIIGLLYLLLPQILLIPNYCILLVGNLLIFLKLCVFYTHGKFDDAVP